MENPKFRCLNFDKKILKDVIATGCCLNDEKTKIYLYGGFFILFKFFIFYYLLKIKKKLIKKGYHESYRNDLFCFDIEEKTFELIENKGVIQHQAYNPSMVN